MYSPWVPPANVWLFVDYFAQLCLRRCARPPSSCPKGFMWETDTASSKAIIDQQRRYALKSVKRASEEAEDSIENKVSALPSSPPLAPRLLTSPCPPLLTSA